MVDSTKSGSDTSDSPSSRALLIQGRAKSIDLAVKLEYVYEFKADGQGKVSLAKTNPLLKHSWTRGGAGTAAVNKTFPLTPEGSDKYAIDLPTGVTAVLGKSGTGKSRFTFDHLFYSTATRGAKPLYIKAFEPGDSARLMKFSVPATFDEPEFELDLASALAEALLDPTRDLIIVDSLRYLFYSSAGGATGKGGVNMSLFMDLTHLDTVATRLNKRVVVVINPMTDDDAAFAFYAEAAVGAVSAVVVMQDYKTARVSNRLKPSRDFVPLEVPKSAATDAERTRSGKTQAQSVGHVRGGDPSVRTAIFGRNR